MSKGIGLGYCRVSTQEQVKEGISLEVQEEKIKQYAKLNNLNLVKVIIDEGKSGKDLNREGIQEVLALCQEKEIDHIIVYKLDRLTRRTFDLLYLVEEVFKPANIKFHSITEKIDTSTAQGNFFLTIIGAMAQMERDLISERTKEVINYKISKGENVGSPPLGYLAKDKKLQKNENEFEIVRYIRKLKRQKFSLGKIAKRLNQENIPTKRGGSWYSGTIKYILENKSYYNLNKDFSLA